MEQPEEMAINASALVHEVIREAFVASHFDNYVQNISDLDKPPRWQTWSVGFAVVSACSYSAPLGILLLPFLSKSLYERIMTFLIALGIGALSSNALFIMIPQAFALNTLDDFAYRHKSAIILCAIYIFFGVDRILQYILEIRRRKQVKRKVHASTLAALMDKPKSKSRNITEETTVQDPEQGDETEQQKREREVLEEELETANISNALMRTFSTRRPVAIVRAVEDVELKDQNGHTAHFHVQHHNHNNISEKQLEQEKHEKNNQVFLNVNNNQKKEDDELSVDIQIVEKRVVEPAALQVASVAYMLIFGSSANNFVDGMSMGAAFSDSIMRGVSIGIAVISQQFPQELGTLAILIKSGLGLKRTLLLNMVPIVLSYMGFGIGVILDNVNDAYDEYVFAISSGMYLYIFLGTLIPEMRDSTNDIIKTDLRESLVVTCLQVAGIGSGVALMIFMSSISEAADISQ